MSVKKQAVAHIDGTDYLLDSYPSAQIKMLEFDMLDTAEQVEELEEIKLTPELSVTEVHREYEASKALVNGGITRAYRLGETSSAIIGFGPNICPQVLTWVEDRDGTLTRSETLTGRLDWLVNRGNNVVWTRRSDTGDGVLLPETIYMVAFTSANTEAAFLKQFPEVVA